MNPPNEVSLVPTLQMKKWRLNRWSDSTKAPYWACSLGWGGGHNWKVSPHLVSLSCGCRNCSLFVMEGTLFAASCWGPRGLASPKPAKGLVFPSPPLQGQCFKSQSAASTLWLFLTSRNQPMIQLGEQHSKTAHLHYGRPGNVFPLDTLISELKGYIEHSIRLCHWVGGGVGYCMVDYSQLLLITD